jgi:hypothetical protein
MRNQTPAGERPHVYMPAAIEISGAGSAEAGSADAKLILEVKVVRNESTGRYLTGDRESYCRGKPEARGHARLQYSFRPDAYTVELCAFRGRRIAPTNDTCG